MNLGPEEIRRAMKREEEEEEKRNKKPKESFHDHMQRIPMRPDWDDDV